MFHVVVSGFIPPMVRARTICFLRLFGTCSTPTSLGHAQASYKFPPTPPWALSMRMAGAMQRTSNTVWMGDNAMGWLVATGCLVAICKAAAHRVPCIPRAPPIASHAPRLLHPTCPTRCIPCTLPVASHCPRHRVPHGHAVVSHTSVSLHASQPQCAARPC